MTSALDYLQDAAQGAAKGAAFGSVVPGIGTAIGGAAGGLIGLASTLVPHIFGEDATPVLQAAAAAITGATTEDAQVQVLSTDSAALAQFKVQALKIAADREQAQLDAQSNDITTRLADVSDARQTTVDLAKAGSQIAWGAPVVSLVVLVSFGVVLTLVISRGVAPGAEQVANVLLGSLGAMATSVVSYWVGSSAGSASKDAKLATMVPASILPKPAAIVPAK